MGLSSSSAAGGPATRAYPSGDAGAQLEEALRAAEAFRVQAEVAQAAAKAALERHEFAALPEPAPTRGQEAVTRLETKAKALTPGDGDARDRSRSARASQQAERVKPQLTARAKTPSAVRVPLWSTVVPGPPPGIALPSVPKAQLPSGRARQPPIGAPPPAAIAKAVDYGNAGDEPTATPAKAVLCPARLQQAPIGAPPPRVPDLELDDDATGVRTTYPPRGWRIPRDQHGEIALDDVRLDIDNMVGDIANGKIETEALRRWRDRIRAARHNARKWYDWQVERGIVPSGPITPEPGAPLPAATEAPPLYRGRTTAKAKRPGGKGFPLARSQTPGKAKGLGKGRGAWGQPAGKGGKKGAHPGRGEHSRYAGYSRATSDSVPSVQFQDSVPAGQAKGAPPKGTPSTAGRTGDPSDNVPIPEYIPDAMRGLSPAAFEAARREAEAFNNFLESFPAGSQPVIPKPAPSAAAGKTTSPMMTYAGPVVPNPTPEPLAQMATSEPTDAVGLDTSPAPAGEEAEGTAPVGDYPPLHQPAAVTVLDGGTPPPPPPTAILGRHVTVYNSGLPGIDGYSGYVQEYDPSIDRYTAQQRSRVLFRVVHLAADSAASRSSAAPANAEASASRESHTRLQASAGSRRPP